VTEIAKNVTSIGTGLLAGVITNAIDPNQKLGHQGDLLATAGINVALDAGVATIGTGIVSGSLGAGLVAGASTVAEGALPVLAGYEVGDTVYNAMNKATAGWKDREAAAVVSGSVSGASGGLAAAGTGLVVKGAVQAVRAAFAVPTAIADAGEFAGTAAEIGGTGLEAAEVVAGASAVTAETTTAEVAAEAVAAPLDIETFGVAGAIAFAAAATAAGAAAGGIIAGVKAKMDGDANATQKTTLLGSNDLATLLPKLSADPANAQLVQDINTATSQNLPIRSVYIPNASDPRNTAGSTYIIPQLSPSQLSDLHNQATNDPTVLANVSPEVQTAMGYTDYVSNYIPPAVEATIQKGFISGISAVGNFFNNLQPSTTTTTPPPPSQNTTPSAPQPTAPAVSEGTPGSFSGFSRNNFDE